MALYALTVLVFSTTRSNSAVSALLVSFVLPQIVLSPFAGVIVDRLDLRWALVVPNFVRMLLTAALALVGADVPLLLALNLGISLMSVALTPAEASMIPRVVPKPSSRSAMSVFNLTLQASFAVGFAFLGPLLVADRGAVVRAGRRDRVLRRRHVRHDRPAQRSARFRTGPDHRRAAGATRSGSCATACASCAAKPGDQPADHRPRGRRPRSPESSASWVRRWRLPSASSRSSWPSSSSRSAWGSSPACSGCAGSGRDPAAPDGRAGAARARGS